MYSGASVLAFADYFRNAQVTGVDTQLDRVKFGGAHPRVRYASADATSPPQLLEALGEEDRFDLILDDASHAPDDQARTFEILAHRVASPDGLYVIEDIDGGAVHALVPRLGEIARRNGMHTTTFDLRAKRNQFDDIVFVASWTPLPEIAI